MKDLLNTKINDYCNYVNLGVKNFKSGNYSDSAINSRKSAEAACKIIIYNAFHSKLAEEKIKDKSLKELIILLIRDSITERKAINNIEALQIIGNKAAHDNIISKEEAAYSLNASNLLTDYLFKECLKIQMPSTLNFDVEIKKEVEVSQPKIIKEIIIQEKIIQEKIDKEKEAELFNKIKQIQEQTENEKYKYDHLKKELDKAQAEFKEFSEHKKANELRTQTEDLNHLVEKKTKKKRLFAFSITVTGLIFLSVFLVWHFKVKNNQNVISQDLPITKHPDTVYVAINKLQVLQDNPQIDFKVEAILQSYIFAKSTPEVLPIKIIQTDFHNIDLNNATEIVNHAQKLGYDLVHFGNLYETSLADSNVFEISGFLTQSKDRIDRTKKIKFKTLADSSFIKEINDQANMSIMFVTESNIQKRTFPELVKILSGVKSYSEENYLAVLNYLTSYRFQSGDFKGALKDFDILLKHRPDNGSLHNGKGILLMEMNQYDSAEVYLKKAVQIDTTHPSYLLALSDFYIHKKDDKKAEKLLKKAILNNRNYHPAYGLLSNIEYDRKDYMASKRYALNAHRLSKITTKYSYRLAEIYAYADIKTDSAIYFYNLCLGKDCTVVIALNGLANFYLQHFPEKKTVAIYLLAKAKKISVGDAVRNNYGYGLSAYNSKNYKEALLYFHKVHNEFPDYGDVLNRLATCYLEIGDYGRALSFSYMALKKDSTDSDNVLHHASVLSQIAPNDKKVRYYYDLAIKLNPTNLIVNRNYAVYLFNEGEYKKCIQFCGEALKTNPNDWKLTQYLAGAYSNVGDFKNARLHFEYLNLMHPGNDTIMFQLAQCYYGTCKKIDKEFAVGVKLARQALDMNPNSAVHNLLMAQFMYSGNNPGMAIEYYQKAKSLNKNISLTELEYLLQSSK